MGHFARQNVPERLSLGRKIVAIWQPPTMSQSERSGAQSAADQSIGPELSQLSPASELSHLSLTEQLNLLS